MLVEGIQVVSINDCIRKMCFPSNPNASISTLISKFVLLISKYLYEGAHCYRADAEDKTKHVLIELDLLLSVFSDNGFVANLKASFLDSALLSREFFNLVACCCCCTKVKKALICSESFSDFVKAGPVLLNSFYKIKSRLEKIVCLDIEAFEFNHQKILEVGVVTYNLRDGQMDPYHIVIDEHYHLCNGKYVINNKEKFNFGISKRMSLNAAIDFVILQLTQPNTCLLGHNIKSDISFLQQQSSHKFTLPIFDTQAIYKYHVLSQNPSSLSKVLDDLNIPYSNLHNAGNDAYYTLLAFIKLANLG